MHREPELSVRRKIGRKKQKNRHKNSHHPYPRSRKKDGDFGKFKPILSQLRLTKTIKLHNAWHCLFVNFFPEEIISLIKNALREGKKSQKEIISFIKKFRRENQPNINVGATIDDLIAWREVFGNYVSWRKIKTIIQKEWMYPGIQVIISKYKIVGIIVFLKNVPQKARLANNISRCKNIYITKNDGLLKIT